VLPSLASWALVMAHHQEPDNTRVGFVYIVMASLGTMALLLAFALLAGPLGGYTFTAMRANTGSPGLASLVLALACRSPSAPSCCGSHAAVAPYAFLAAEGEGLHQIPVGPVHAGVIEPGHFRFHASGETIARLEQRLGYTHKGVEGLMAGASLDRATRLAARTSGDSTVAYSIAFSRAVESALCVEVAGRAI
jgi:hypothetical protein